MRKTFCILFILLAFGKLSAQDTTKQTSKFSDYFDINYFNDFYVVQDMNFNEVKPYTRQYASVGKIAKEIRLQEYRIAARWDSPKFWALLSIQNGDGPLMMKNPNADFINYIDRAYFGAKLSKNLKVDVGYMWTYIGFETSAPASSKSLSSVSLCGYFQPGNILGAKFRYQFTPKLEGMLAIYNSYTYLDKQTNALTQLGVENLGLGFTYKFNDKITLTYGNMYTNIGDRMDSVYSKNAQNLFYNNIYATYVTPKLYLVAELDVFQQNNTPDPDSTTSTDWGVSSTFQGKYYIIPQIGVLGRYGFLMDGHGILSGLQEGYNKGLRMHEFAAGLEYRPFPYLYARLEYQYMINIDDIPVFHNNKFDHRHSIMFSTGISLNKQNVRGILADINNGFKK